MGEIRILQVTAAISPGSSGSPVLNASGDVIGVAKAMLGGGQALNFAVPAETLRSLVTHAQRSSGMKLLMAVQTTDKDKLSTDPDGKAAIAAYATKDYIECLKRAQVLVQRYPENALAYGLLGFAYNGLHFNTDAISACQQAVKLKPDWAGAWHMLGLCYARADEIDYAIAAYQQAIKVNPEWVFVWYAVAVIVAGESGMGEMP